MKLIILRDNLKLGLERVSRAISETSQLPILKNILLKTKNNKVYLLGTNLELAVTANISGKIIENGECAIPFNVFSTIVNNLDSDRINLDKKENTLIIKTDNYSATIQGMDPADFPIIPDIENKKNHIEINSGVLKESFLKVISSAQTSDFRPELNGVLFDLKKSTLTLATTDSFRLAEKTITTPQFTNSSSEEYSVIIPLKTIHEITRTLPTDIVVRIYCDKNQILFSCDAFEMISRLIEGKFPDYEQIIPKSFDTEISINREQFINAIKLSSTFTGKINDIKLKVNEEEKALYIYSADTARGENTYVIPIKLKGNGVEMSFNWRFLLDGLRAIVSENVFFGLNNKEKPTLLKTPEDATFFYVVMPIKST